jgi:hypothetical protein
MKQTVKLITCHLSLAAMLSGCGEPLMNYDINTDTPIVESYLQEGTNSLTVNVFSMEAYLKDGYELSKPISGLNIHVNNQALTENPSGTYSLDLGNDTIQENQKYDLQFDYNGKTITASTTVPAPLSGLCAVPDILIISSSYLWSPSDSTEVVVSWDDPDNSYYQVYIYNPNTSDMPSLGVFGRRMMQPFKGHTYRATGRDFRSAGACWIYVYRVDKEYVDLYESISATDLANPVSYIQNAFGIFTSMSVARIQVIVHESSE